MSEPDADLKESLVFCQSSQAAQLRGSLLRFTRHLAVFELYTPDVVLRMSEVLEDFKVIIAGRTVYSGRALVSNLVNTGAVLVCEAKLDESLMTVAPLDPAPENRGLVKEQFDDFLRQWQKNYRVLPEFKAVMGDMQTFLSDLRLWLDQAEVAIRSSPSGNRSQLEREVLDELAEPIVGGINTFIERFEHLAAGLEPNLHPVHCAYLRRQLHPLLLCSPFAYRAFHKPLGYAGDYEMVDMMMRLPYEGSTLFSKLINVWLLGQAPVIAHRNRVEYLGQKLLEEALLARHQQRVRRVYNLGCGPAVEVQAFLRDQPFCNQLDFTLLDFNDETLAHSRRAVEGLKQSYGRSTSIQFLKRSVQQILKESGQSVQRSREQQYDFIYCAGLFDYFSDPICRRLMGLFYEMLAPGGLLVATNVSDAMNRSRPFRYSMEYILDWHLVYRDGAGMAALVPRQALDGASRIVAENSGVNLILEVRKPNHA